MAKHRKKNNLVTVALPILAVLAGLLALSALLLQGNNVALVQTKGWIANEQFRLMAMSVGIMLVIAIPALFLLYFTAWKYRETNHHAKRDPEAGRGKLLNAAVWLIPGTIAVILAFIMVPATHKLEPKRLIAANAEPMKIQVVAMRWKWLFIYPEQDIATVNYVRMPVGTPVTFELTADETPMSSFWIPNLGGMLYVMNGHVNVLNLIADTPGKYPGSTAEINGSGFAGMRFTAHATSKEDFDRWVRDVRGSSSVLDDERYAQLLQPSENNPEAFYLVTDDELYDKVVMKYQGAHDHQPAAHHGAHH